MGIDGIFHAYQAKHSMKLRNQAMVLGWQKFLFLVTSSKSFQNYQLVYLYLGSAYFQTPISRHPVR